MVGGGSEDREPFLLMWQQTPKDRAHVGLCQLQSGLLKKDRMHQALKTENRTASATFSCNFVIGFMLQCLGTR